MIVVICNISTVVTADFDWTRISGVQPLLTHGVKCIFISFSFYRKKWGYDSTMFACVWFLAFGGKSNCGYFAFGGKGTFISQDGTGTGVIKFRFIKLLTSIGIEKKCVFC